MKKKRSGYWLLGFCLAVNLVFGVVLHAAGDGAEDEDVYREIDVMMEILQTVRRYYVDTDKASASKLMRGAVRGMLMTLDPHTAYMEGAEQQLIHEETDGEFGGVGVQVDYRHRRLVVVAPIDGTPAQRAGLRTGDWIQKIDGERIAGMNYGEVLRRMRGKPGTEVRLTYLREGFEKPREVLLVRAMIPIQSIRNARVVNGFGYVRITQFMDKTASELETVLRERFSDESVRGLVIDLRDNPGGLVNSAVDICSFFLPEGAFVVSLEGRVEQMTHRAKGGYKFRDIPLMVLVNEGSASAAELMSGCLQVRGRATVIGCRTYGKGSSQRVLPLSNGSELKLTMAYYYVEPPEVTTRRRVHGNGILPDVDVIPDDAYRASREHEYRTFRQELSHRKLSDAERFHAEKGFIERFEMSDAVVQKAFSLLEHPETLPAARAETSRSREKAEKDAQARAEAEETDEDEEGEAHD